MVDDAARRIADIASEAINAATTDVPKGETGGNDGVRDRPVPRKFGFSVEKMNEEWAFVLMGSKAVMVRNVPTAPVEDRVRILGLESFRAKYLNRFTEIIGNDGKIKANTWAQAWLGNHDRRDYDGIEFFPSATGEKGTPGYLNLWQGFSVQPIEKENGYSIFRDHLLTNACHGNPVLYDWVFGWFAHMMQYPRDRVGTSLVLRGKMGTGKTKIGEVFGSLLEAHYFMVDDPRYIVGQFNAHMASCLLLQAEEAVWAGDKSAEGRLKSLVTSETQMIEAKGVDSIRLHNYVRLIMTSNEDWVVPAGKDERRFCVLDIGDYVAQNHEYFREMEDQLDNGGREALLYDLLNFDLTKVNIRLIPKTAALLEQKLRSLDSVESWWFERLESGVTTRMGSEWRRQIPIETLFRDYISQADMIGIKRKNEKTAFGMKMFKLVPGLARERGYPDMADHETVGPGTTRVWCYAVPSLDDCRRAFAESVGQDVVWPETGA
jgi:hypothetical protein